MELGTKSELEARYRQRSLFLLLLRKVIRDLNQPQDRESRGKNDTVTISHRTTPSTKRGAPHDRYNTPSNRVEVFDRPVREQSGSEIQEVRSTFLYTVFGRLFLSPASVRKSPPRGITNQPSAMHDTGTPNTGSGGRSSDSESNHSPGEGSSSSVNDGGAGVENSLRVRFAAMNFYFGA